MSLRLRGKRFRSLRAMAAIAATAGLVAGLAVTAGVASPAAAASLPPQGPAGDAFYTPPSPLPAGQPGDVIWQRVQATDLQGTTYLVLYRSTSATGKAIAVSGTVKVPKNKVSAATPIIGVAPGTTGIGDTCATSKMGLQAVWSPDFSQDGYAVATTDYEGLGTPGDHTYVVGLSEGHAVIDVVRAAAKLGVGLSTSAPVGFVGYSQGGGGSAWAGELAPSYAPELKVKGIAAGGVPADMIAVGKFLDGGIGFGFLAAAATGLNAAYPELNLQSYLNAEGKKVFAENANACVQDVIAKLAGKHIADYTTTDPMTTPAWQARLKENSLGSRKPAAPVLLYHSLGDEILPYDQDHALRDTYCRAGVNVKWNWYLGEHVTGVLAGYGDVHTWIVDRMKGRTATGNC